VETQELDGILMDLNFTRDTTAARRGSTCCGACAPSTAALAGDRDDGVLEHRRGVEAMRRGARDTC